MNRRTGQAEGLPISGTGSPPGIRRPERRPGRNRLLVEGELRRGILFHCLGQIEASTVAFRQARHLALAAGLPVLVLEASLRESAALVRLGEAKEARRRALADWRCARRLARPTLEARALVVLAEAETLRHRLCAARVALSWAERRAPLSEHGLAGKALDLRIECGLRRALLFLAEGQVEPAANLAGSMVEWMRDRARLTPPARLAYAQAARLHGTALVLLGRNEEGLVALESCVRTLARMGEAVERSLAEDWMRRAAEDRSGRDGSYEDKKQAPVCSAARGRLSSGEATAPAFAAHLPPMIHASQVHATHPPDPVAAPAVDPRRRIEVVQRGDDRSAHGAMVREPQIWPPSPAATPARALSSRSVNPRTTRLHPRWAELGLVTRTPGLLDVLAEAEARARAGDIVLILGETGTGKDLLARGIHEISGRPGNYVPFNCAACPVDLVESELFGAERGAFTGADRRRCGLVHDATRGTLFLDEIGDLPARAQGAVLRFIDQGEVRALGSSAVRRIEVGLVAATHQPLSARVREGTFRRDLYFRVAQGVIELPALRQRSEDLDLLLRHLWRRLMNGDEPPGWLLSPPVLRTLRAHDWPGNIRELEQFIRTVRLHPEAVLDEESIRPLLGCAQGDGELGSTPRERAVEAIRLAGGNRSRAAAILGWSRSRLYRVLGPPEEIKEADA